MSHLHGDERAVPTSVHTRIDGSTNVSELKMLFPDSDFELATYEAIDADQRTPMLPQTSSRKLHGTYMAQETKFAEVMACNKAVFRQAKRRKANAKTPELRASFAAKMKLLKHIKQALVALHEDEVRKIKAIVDGLAESMQKLVSSSPGKEAFVLPKEEGEWVPIKAVESKMWN